MKTALFSPLYLDGSDPVGNSRFTRNQRYIQWNRTYRKEIGFDDIWMVDNGSKPNLLANLLGQFPDLNIMRYPNLERTHHNNGYIYCWRALWFVRALISLGYEKIIFLDSDCYIISERLAEFVRSIESGWHAFKCQKYNFPTAEFNILTRNTFDVFLQYTNEAFESKNGILMERDLPFTHVNSIFNCDRYGETRTPQSPEMDLYSQRPLDIELTFQWNKP